MKGHIRERSPGHWAIVIDVRDPTTGKRKRRWHSFEGTKRQAQVECARLVSEAQHGGAVEPTKIGVSGFLDRFERDWVQIHLSARSAERYRTALGHVRKHLGDRPLQKLQSADIAALYARLVNSLAPRSIRLVHAAFHRALGQARTWGLVRDNVADVVRPPKAPDKETTILQPDQAGELLARLRGKPLYLIASLALGTGMRRSEMLALRWRDLDLDAGHLVVERALEQTSAIGIRAKGPKTKHGRRTISLPPHLVEGLRQHWRAQQEQRLALGLGRAPDDAPVFADHLGGFLSPNAITKAWPVAMTQIGMPDVTLHSLRHTHASMLIASGMNILTISRRLGHSSPTITLGVYGHLIHGTDEAAARIMERAFGSKLVASSAGKPEK
jgi:integrase